jgi:hypothetical protein
VTSSFKADPQALQTASTQFAAQVDPINTKATQAEAVQGNAGNTGRQYGAQGTAYHSAMLTFVQTLLTPMATKATWVSDTLASTSADYKKQDDAASQGLNSAGKGAMT